MTACVYVSGCVVWQSQSQSVIMYRTLCQQVCVCLLVVRNTECLRGYTVGMLSLYYLGNCAIQNIFIAIMQSPDSTPTPYLVLFRRRQTDVDNILQKLCRLHVFLHMWNENKPVNILQSEINTPPPSPENHHHQPLHSNHKNKTHTHYKTKTNRHNTHKSDIQKISHNNSTWST